MSSEAGEFGASTAHRWNIPFSWVGLIAIAWLLFEITHSPALSSVLICLKFGWEDLRAARWIWKSDPVPARRRSLFWLYLSWGLWKCAIVAFVMTLAFAVVTPRNVVPQAIPQALRAFLGTFLTTVVCFSLSTLTTGLAVFLAWRGGYRLWLDSGVYRACRFNFYPPTPFCEGRPNRLGFLLLTGLGLIALVVLAFLLGNARRLQGGFALSFLLTITAPVTIVLLRELLTRRIWAESPSECWPEEWDIASETDETIA